jgi:hypothetical protein
VTCARGIAGQRPSRSPRTSRIAERPCAPGRRLRPRSP